MPKRSRSASTRRANRCQRWSTAAHHKDVPSHGGGCSDDDGDASGQRGIGGEFSRSWLSRRDPGYHTPVCKIRARRTRMTIDYDDPSSTPSSAAGDKSKPVQVAERAGAEASNVASTTVEGVREVADEVKSQAGAVAGEARQQIEQLMGQARGEFREQAQQRNDQAADQLRSLSGQLVALAEGRPQDAGPLASYAREAEDQVRRLASRLEQGGAQGVVDDVSRFARRRPGTVPRRRDGRRIRSRSGGTTQRPPDESSSDRRERVGERESVEPPMTRRRRQRSDDGCRDDPAAARRRSSDLDLVHRRPGDRRAADR